MLSALQLLAVPAAWPATRYDRLTGVDLGRSLQLVLANRDLCQALQANMDATFTGEGLAFLQAYFLAGEKMSGDEAAALTERFILDNAPQQINTASELRFKIIDSYTAKELDVVSSLLKTVSREVFDDVKRSQNFNAFLRTPQSKGAIVLKHRHTVLSEEMIRILDVAANLHLTKKLLKVLVKEGDYYWSNRLRFLSSMAVDFDSCDSKTKRSNMARKIVSVYLIKGSKFEFSVAAFLYENIVVREKFSDLAMLRTEVAEELSLSSFVSECLKEMDSGSKRTINRMSLSSPLGSPLSSTLKMSDKTPSTRTSPISPIIRTLSDHSVLTTDTN